MNLLFPEFAPDKSIYTGGSTLTNVVPVSDGWGPLADLTVISEALASTCLGAWYARTSASAYRIFAGTATKLYEYNSADATWTDISDGATFAVPDGDEWQAHQFGANLLFTNISDGLLFIDIDAGSAVAAIAAAPKAKYIGSAGDYLVLGHIADHPNRIHTSGINDATFWTVGQNGCDFQSFPTGEEVMGIVSSEKGAVIAQRTRLRTMTIQASEFSFRTDEVNNSRGVISPLSLASIGPGRFVYYSADGFFMGLEGTPIGQNRVDRWFDEECDRAQLHRVKAMVDPFQKIVWFQGVTEGDAKFLLGYHWALNRWCYADSNLVTMAALVTPAITIDGLDALYDSIDEVSESFDARLLSGGVPTMAVFNTDNQLCYLTGSPRAATLQTVDAELTPGRRSFLREAMAAGDCATFTLAPVTSDKFGGTRTTGTGVSPYSATGICHFRSDARFHAFQMSIAAGTDWNQVIGVQNIVWNESGKR